MAETANPPWLVRVETRGGTILGSGFLASTDTLVTCAHVIDPAPSAEAPVTLHARFVHALDAPAIPVEFCANAFHPLDGTHAGMDLAVGTLVSPPPQGARPTKLFDSLSLAGHELTVKGFPAGADWGDTVSAIAVAEGGPHPGWWEIHPRDDHGSWIERGFSGAPVWSETIGAVVAMAVARTGKGADREAYAIPVGGLVEAHPELAMVVQLDLDYEHAETQLRQRILDLQARGSSAERIAGAQYALAVVLIREEKDLDEAEKLISMARDTDDSDALPAGATSFHTALGNVRLLQGRNRDAIASFSEAIAATQSLAPDHPRRAPPLNGRGVANTNLGLLDDALDDLARAREIEEQAFGVGHLNLSTVFQNLAGVFTQMGRFDEAESLAGRAHKIELNTNGDSHPRTALAGRSLAKVLLARGCRDRARGLLVDAQVVIERNYPSNHMQVALTISAVGRLDLVDGDPDGAFAHFSKALAIIESTLGADHPMAASTIADQGFALFARDEPTRAAEFVDRGIKLAERSDVAAGELARLYSIRGTLRMLEDPEGALADAERVAELLRSRTNDPLAELTALRVLAQTNLRAQRLDEAEALAREGLATLDKPMGDAARAEAVLRDVLGACLAYAKEFGSAEGEFREALRLAEMWGGAHDVGTGFMYLDLGTVLRAQRRKAESDRAFLRGLEILGRTFPPGHSAMKAAKLRGGARVWIKHLARRRGTR